MTFTTTHTRAFIGTDINLTISASAKEQIATVTVTFDGETLEELELGSGTENYLRNFSQVGGSTPGTEHTLLVTATDADNFPHSATTRWNDS